MIEVSPKILITAESPLSPAKISLILKWKTHIVANKCKGTLCRFLRRYNACIVSIQENATKNELF